MSLWSLSSQSVCKVACLLISYTETQTFTVILGSPVQIGTYQMAMCSKAHNKPFYVVAESFKFVRLYPLNQQDVPDKFKVRQNRMHALPFTAFLYTTSSLLQYKADTLKTVKNLSEEHPMIDYTPPSLITLLFTDLGVLTPSAVSDELIKLYL